MKMMKRTLLSMKRRPYQMVLMFLIVFILGNVLFASIAVKQSSEAVKAEMRKRIPAKINLEITDRFAAYDSEGYLLPMYDFVKDMESDKQIKKVETLEIIHLNSRKQDDPNWERLCSNYNELYSFQSLDHLIANFTITEGRNYTQEDLESEMPKIVLANNMAEQVGDTFKLNIIDYGKIDGVNNLILGATIEFEVIGKFDMSELVERYDGINYGSLFVYQKWADQFLQTKEKLKEAHIKEETDEFAPYENNFARYFFDYTPKISAVYLEVEGMDALERLEKEIKENINYLRTKYTMESSASDYRFIEGPLENLVALADVAMIASIILTIVLLGLVSMMFMRMRKHEIGILMALGERKHKVLGQYVCEIILIGLLAATCAIYSGNKMGSMISNEFIKIQVDADSEMEYQEQGEITQLDMMEAYEVKLDGQYIVSIYGVTFVILLLSSAVPVLFILRTKPKEVLM